MTELGPMGDAHARDWALPAAAGMAALETTVLIGVLALSGAPLAPFVIAALLVKYPFCYLLLKRSAGAYLGLLLWEGAGIMAALGAPAPVALRLLELGLAGATLALLLAAVRAFPAVELQKR